MSQVFSGVSNIYIGAHTTQTWNLWWNSSGWQGDTFNQPQPLNTGASLASSVSAVSLNSNGQYVYTLNITNNGPNSTYFNIQTSKN